MTKKQIIATIMLIGLLIAIGIIGFLYFNRKEQEPVIIKQEDIIKNYNYTIKETDSKLKKEKFQELKTILASSEINYEEYAKKLAELFVVDVYDLNSKINKYDVGGLEYILEEQKDNLKLVLQDSLYSNLKDNSDQKRKQELPIVSKAKATNISTGEYNYNNTTYDVYNVNVLIDYQKDLGYDKDVYVKIIEKDNKLFVVKIEPN